MRYSAFIIWLILSAIMCILIFPAMIANVCGWFELGDKIKGGNNEHI
jgi:hypothetical protein